MKLKEILKFNLLKEDLPVVILATEIEEKEKELFAKINAIQAKCQHAWEKNYQYPRRLFENEKGAVLSKNCNFCGKHEDKPIGMPWEICEGCWGEMESLGQGLVGEDRTHFYKCKNCDRKYSHT